jgi:hypothetical protein
VVAHAASAPLVLAGKFIDVLHPDLRLLDGLRLEPGQSGLYRDVGMLETQPGGGRPRVLHSTHRLLEDRFAEGVTRVRLRGPLGTPAVARLSAGGWKAVAVTARDASGKDLEVNWRQEGPTVLARFPNDPEGAVLEVRWDR